MQEYLSLTELGQVYGVTRNWVGQWLVDLGLRTKEKKPGRAAFDCGDQRTSTQPITFSWAWHAEKTTRLMDGAGFQKADRQEG